jgi:uncharacterized protein (DUF952 family)
MTLIYKLLTWDQWQAAQAAGVFVGSPVDLADGYIHFSTAAQVQETARRYFAHQDDLVMLTVQSDYLGADLKWEPSRGGDLFPHLYNRLRLDHVAQVTALTLDAQGVPVLENPDA